MNGKTVAPRFSLHLPLLYRRSGEANWRKSSTNNLSSSGALFVTTEPLPVGTRLEMAIGMAAESLVPSRVVTLSEVVRQNVGDSGLDTAVKHITYEMERGSLPEMVAN